MEQILEQHDKQILILSLQGFIFFGSTHQLFKPIINRIENHHDVPLNYLVFVFVFDFRHITGLDSSAINSFKKLSRKAKSEGFSVVLCGLSEPLTLRLTSEELIPDESKVIQAFRDLDYGLEWCEEKIIKNNWQLIDYECLMKLSGDGFCSITNEFSDFLEDLYISGGTKFIDQGQDTGGIYFIESGEVVVVLNEGPDKRMSCRQWGQGL